METGNISMIVIMAISLNRVALRRGIMSHLAVVGGGFVVADVLEIIKVIREAGAMESRGLYPTYDLMRTDDRGTLRRWT